MTNTTALDLNRLEALAKAATPGPWHSSDAYADNGAFSGVDICADDGTVLLSEDSGPGTKDAEFIAAANPAAILQLIANLRTALAAKGQQEPVAISADWDEDFAHENGNYENQCGNCGGRFRGHKRRTVCKICAAPVAQQSEAGAPTAAANQPELTVWYGAMPESNGKSNFTAILKRKGAGPFDTCHITIDRSEYPDRVRYEADRVRWIIGELAEEPFILDYDADKHSGYVKPEAGRESAAPAAPVREGDREQDADLATARDAVRRVMADLSVLHEDKPEEMAAIIAMTATLVSGDLELAANSIDAAMQKGDVK